MLNTLHRISLPCKVYRYFNVYLMESWLRHAAAISMELSEAGH